MNATDRSDYWRVDGLAGVSFFKADFLHHSYSRHTHDEYAIGSIEAGQQTFHCRGGQQLSSPGSLILVNPDDLHDGHGVDGGYRYRMLYIEPAVVAGALRDSGEREGRWPLFRAPVVHDPQLAAALCAFNRRSEEGAELLELESRLLALLHPLLQRHAGGALKRTATAGREAAVVRRACRVLDERFAAPLSLGDLAAECGMSRFALLRLFAKHVGMPPHAYVTRARLREARRLLLQGETPASVAAAVGYVDQSHLTKRFRAAFGITPGQFVSVTR